MKDDHKLIHLEQTNGSDEHHQLLSTPDNNAHEGQNINLIACNNALAIRSVVEASAS